ncbi:SDR family oxidoreductase [Bacillus sp. FJAT-45037]|uniref:SDR family oxidoreductase n=1 Tax=Bacillus sp. FJAT-45037 TaxID=2011007 RepID=UPI000C2377EF|nr:SDR family oxidoreductase [Bacillus sp. FJAT-45037]
MEKEVVMITGASSGLGAALAKQYMSIGAHVCLVGRSRETLRTTIENDSKHYSIYEGDITDKSDVTRIVFQIEDEVGKVDMLINNAGVGFFGLAEDLSEPDLSTMIDVNVKGTIYCTQAILPEMKKRNKGTIVNIISTAGRLGKANESGYVASKFAVRGFTESLQAELAHTMIRVSGVYMGGMNTPFWEGILPVEKRELMMQPEDVAEIIVHNLQERRHVSVEEIVIKNKKPNK